MASSVPGSAFASPVFPFLSGLISHAFLPGSCTRLPVCFLSPFLASLPQLFHECLPCAFAFGLFQVSFRFLSSASVSLPATWPSVLPFPSSCFRLFSGLHSASVLPFGFPVFHLLFRLVSHASFPVSGTWLSVRFLSSFPASLPQLFHRCFPSFPRPCVRFFPGLFCLLSASFRLLQPASDYSAFCAFFSLLPVLPWQRFLRCLLSSSVGPVSMPSFRFRYSASCISFLRSLSRLTVATSAPQPSDFSSGLVPLAFALGSGYSAPPVIYHFRSGLAYISTGNPECQPLFCTYFDYYLAICNQVVFWAEKF